MQGTTDAAVVNVDQPLNMLPMLGVLQQMQPALRGANFAAAFEPFRQSMGVDQLPEPLRSAVTATKPSSRVSSSATGTKP